MRLRDIEDLGKCEALLAASKLIRDLDAQGQPSRLLELGGGGGQIIGALVNASVGVDRSADMLARAKHACPALHLVQGDYTATRHHRHTTGISIPWPRVDFS